MSFRNDNYELFREILKIIKRCDSEYGDLLEDEGAELIMKAIEKNINEGRGRWKINLHLKWLGKL